MKRKFIIWLCERRIRLLDSVDAIIAENTGNPDMTEPIWGLLFWMKYSLERKIERNLKYLER